MGNRGSKIKFKLKPDFRFIHEPLPQEKGGLPLAGRDLEMKHIKHRIRFSEGGAFLIAGYRGVGKSSFINRAIGDLRQNQEALPFQILDIHLNLARPMTPSELMHHIIRRLYYSLKEENILELLEPELARELTLAFRRTSLNLIQKQTESKESVATMAVTGKAQNPLIGAVFSPTVARKRSQGQEEEMSYLGYDDKAAEYDVINLSTRITAGYLPLPRPYWFSKRSPIYRRCFRKQRRPIRILFVFDEIDKLEGVPASSGSEKTYLDDLLESLKNLFTTSKILYMFIAGRDMYERWLADVGKGDSVYESIFAHDLYLPCLWGMEKEICNHLLHDSFLDLMRSEDASDHGYGRMRQNYEDFLDYLGFKGRGIPRKIIREFNCFVEAEPDAPHVVFNRQNIRRVRFFAALQRAVKEHLGGLAQTVNLGSSTREDKFQLVSYYLLDWLLNQGGETFNEGQAMNHLLKRDPKIAPTATVGRHIAQSVLSALLKNNYIEVDLHKGQAGERANSDTAAERSYRLSQWTLLHLREIACSPTEQGLAPESSLGRLGRFTLQERIGGGGSSDVYKAWDGSRYVAVKKLSKACAQYKWAHRMFAAEQRVMKDLKHAHLACFIEAGKEGGLPYIVMDHIDGLNLHQILRYQGPLNLEQAICVTRKVANTLSYINEKGYVRNDLKPTNIMIDRDGRLRFIDLGLLKHKDDSHDRVVVGTPGYMAPEQERGEVSDQRSDIFQLGLLMFRMVSGEGPAFVTLTGPSKYRARALGNLGSAPESLQAIIKKCLKHEPEQRYQSYQELLRALPTGESVPLEALYRNAHEGHQQDEQNLMEATRMVSQTQPEESHDQSSEADTASQEPERAMMRKRSFSAALDDDVDEHTGAQQPSRSAGSTGEPPLKPDSAEPENLETLSPFEEDTADLEAADESEDAPELAAAETSAEDALLGFLDDDLKAANKPVGGQILKLGPNRVGRVQNNEITISAPGLSRFHALITLEEDRVTVTDMGSSNGTYVNQKAIRKTNLKVGDRMDFGGNLFELTKEGNVFSLSPMA